MSIYSFKLLTIAAKFLRSETFRSYMIEQRIQYPSDLHPSLNNESKLTALLRKQRLLAYPLGSDVAGTLF
jgi:hypothetical protein